MTAKVPREPNITIAPASRAENTVCTVSNAQEATRSISSNLSLRLSKTFKSR
jgi:hypothetical protein